MADPFGKTKAGNWRYPYAATQGFIDREIMPVIAVLDRRQEYASVIHQLLKPKRMERNAQGKIVESFSENFVVQLGAIAPRGPVDGEPMMIDHNLLKAHWHVHETRLGSAYKGRDLMSGVDGIPERNLRECIAAANRRVDYDCFQFILGSSELVNDFNPIASDGFQYTDYYQEFTVSTKWCEANSTPIKDLSKAIKQFKAIAGAIPNRLYVGPSTFDAIAAHDGLRAELMYTGNMEQLISGIGNFGRLARLFGIEIIELTGQDWKEEADEQGELGKPSPYGSTRMTTVDNFNAHTYLENPDDDKVEDSILTMKQGVGNVMYQPTHSKKMGNPAVPTIRRFESDWLDKYKVSAEKAYGPYIEYPQEVMIMRGTAHSCRESTANCARAFLAP